MKRFLWIPVMIVLVSVLSAQETSINDEFAVAATFPIALILEKAEFTAGGRNNERSLWQPDWPADIPPDAFMVNSGVLSRIMLQGENFSLEYRCDPEGRPVTIPFFFDGLFIQINLVYGDHFIIREMEFLFGKETEPMKLEFLDELSLINYRSSFPVVIRCSRADNWFFIYLSGGGAEILESWYDEAGGYTGAYGYTLANAGRSRRIAAIKNYSDTNDGNETGFGTERYFDSRGLITESSNDAGVYKVQYFREDFPRYWEHDGKYALQWDDQNFLVRMTGENSEGYADSRYEYTFDEKGNWITRQEIRMYRNAELLVPGQGTFYTRILEYRQP
jgi:hypothetical protein